MEEAMEKLRDEALAIMERFADDQSTFQQAQMELDALMIESIRVLTQRMTQVEEYLGILEGAASGVLPSD